MYIVVSVEDLLNGLRLALRKAERCRDDPTNRQKDTAFIKGEVYALEHAIELTEALLAHQQE